MMKLGTLRPVWIMVAICTVCGLVLALSWRPWQSRKALVANAGSAHVDANAPSKGQQLPAAASFAVPASPPTVDLSQIELRLAALERTGSAATPPPALPRTVEVPSLEEVKAKRFLAHDARLEQHRAQPVDPGWAPRVTEAFQKDLAAVTSAGHFVVVDVDCRTTTCVATLEYPAYQDARQNWSMVLHHQYAENCGCEVVLEDPVDGATKYQTSVVYTCASPRR